MFLVAAVVAQRELVRTAHPHLKARFAATGKLTSEDFAAAAAMPLGKTPARARPRASRVSEIMFDLFDDATCAQYTSTTQCYAGGAESDDDIVLASGEVPGACDMCGFLDYENGETGGDTNWMDCAICADDGHEIVVLFDDCTGLCASASGAAYYESFGFATLDDSACTVYADCYPADASALFAELNGTNTQYIDDDSWSFSYLQLYSYSYSYSFSYLQLYECADHCATCDAPGNYDCDSCESVSASNAHGELRELSGEPSLSLVVGLATRSRPTSTTTGTARAPKPCMTQSAMMYPSKKSQTAMSVPRAQTASTTQTAAKAKSATSQSPGASSASATVRHRGHASETRKATRSSHPGGGCCSLATTPRHWQSRHARMHGMQPHMLRRCAIKIATEAP